MKIEITRGLEADRLLSDEAFLAEWSSLAGQCPWATAFQSHGFARAWYSTYRHQFDPVLLTSRSADGALQGLLALAFCPAGPASESLIVAGRHQAEYHAWLSTPALGNDFPSHAVERLRAGFPRARLTFHYLAPGAPAAWASGPEAGRRCLLRKHRRPLIRFGDGSDNTSSLAKKGNKKKLKELDRMGGLEFKRLTDPAEFEAVFDDIVRLYDFRHGAVQGTDPFCGTELQKKFHVAMMRVPGLLHVTTLRAGGRLAAAHWGAASGKELQLGTIVHDPAMAKQSPGKFQILLLVRMLIGEGFERLDLTPGGDAYKERFASDWDEVCTLDVLPTPLRRKTALVRLRVREAAKRALKARGLSTAQARHHLKATLWELRHPARLATRLLNRVGSRCETHVYSRETLGPDDAGPEAPAGGGTPPAVRRDAIEDLLAYRPAGAGASRQAFLSKALARIEEGQHVYTRVADGRLAHAAWLAERPTAEVPPGVSLPPDGVLLHDVRAFPAARGPSPAGESLRAMLRDAGRVKGVRRAFLLVPGRDAEGARLAERLGFTREYSVIGRGRGGRRRWWVRGPDGVERAVAPPPPPAGPGGGPPDEPPTRSPGNGGRRPADDAAAPSGPGPRETVVS